jgi:hypothetical protein
MTHYTIRYDGSTMTPIEQSKAAIDDIIGWLGSQAKFEEMTGILRDNDLDFDQFEMWVSIVGVQGYPVREWFWHCYGDAKAAVRKPDGVPVVKFRG